MRKICHSPFRTGVRGDFAAARVFNVHYENGEVTSPFDQSGSPQN